MEIVISTTKWPKNTQKPNPMNTNNPNLNADKMVSAPMIVPKELVYLNSFTYSIKDYLADLPAVLSIR